MRPLENRWPKLVMIWTPARQRAFCSPASRIRCCFRCYSWFQPSLENRRGYLGGNYQLVEIQVRVISVLSRFLYYILILYQIRARYAQDMQFGGIIYLLDLSQPRNLPMGKNGMTPMKLSDHPEIAPRVILATVDGNGLMAKLRENQLKDTTWRKMQTRQFTNTKDSAWSIVDTILGTSPIKLCFIQDQLDTIS